MLAEISELAPGFTGELAASPWWHSVRSRIQDAVADAVAQSVLELAADRIERAHGREPLRFGAWHGDLVPWNLARIGSRLYAWDWESSTPCAPLGFDAVHFHYSVAFIAQRRPLAEAAAIAADARALPRCARGAGTGTPLGRVCCTWSSWPSATKRHAAAPVTLMTGSIRRSWAS